MSGESPSAFTHDNVFDFKDGRSSPAPTTSKDDVPHSGTGVVTASVIVEPPKDKEKEKDNGKEKEDDPLSELSSPILNNGDNGDERRRNSDMEKTLKMGDDDYDGYHNNKLEGEKLVNGDADKLDGADGLKDKSEDENQEEDSCIVNCLYYTMQCCECTIM